MWNHTKQLWLGISLKKKMSVYVCLVIFVICLSTAFSFFLTDFALNTFNTILDDNAVCYAFQEAMEFESDAFEAYARDRTDEKRLVYEDACDQTEESLDRLPFDYSVIGAERYAKVWSIRNAYENYCLSRDRVLDIKPGGSGYITSLYEVYSRQDYIEAYARQLLQLTMEAGNFRYQRLIPTLYRIPVLIAAVAAVVVAMVAFITRVLAKTIVDPMEKVADASRRIAVNDFGGEDLEVENRDEMGEMVQAFNRMKHATEGYIQTLTKNYEMAELLHKEEMQKAEIEKRLEATRLDLLKSQINPHFLFNTLNIIACMAKLEEADTTEKMITSMSNLFRYNLKTTEQTVPLRQELNVVQDYMYIQRMRFGERIRYEVNSEADDLAMMMPAFTLQPLVENAIVHGLAKKEQGGRILLRVWEQVNVLMISVADTGVGISEETRLELENALKNRRTSRIGIGLGNIYQRIHAMYPDGDLRLYSRKGCGTVVQIRIPQGSKADGDEKTGEGTE